FQNMSGDAEQEYFTDGVVEEITTALSHVNWLFVIARNSAFAYKGQAVDVTRVARRREPAVSRGRARRALFPPPSTDHRTRTQRSRARSDRGVARLGAMFALAQQAGFS
ncbi:transcriptional regulator, partial [Mesorhizobium sp. M2D.F.Ca.ET.140.01.1.1]